MGGGQLGALLAAVEWLRDVLLSGVAWSVAIIAVAGVGLGMLAGRLDWRRGARVVLGCFVLFGAPSIAAGLMALMGAGEGVAIGQDVLSAAATVPAPLPIVAAPSAVDDDPYAGAAVPPPMRTRSRDSRSLHNSLKERIRDLLLRYRFARDC